MCACDCDATMGNLPSFPSIKDFKNKFSIVVIGELYCEGSLLFVFHETSTTSTSYPVSVLSSLLLRSWTQACTIVCKFFIEHQGFILLYIAQILENSSKLSSLFIIFPTVQTRPAATVKTAGLAGRKAA